MVTVEKPLTETEMDIVEAWGRAAVRPVTGNSVYTAPVAMEYHEPLLPRQVLRLVAEVRRLREGRGAGEGRGCS